MFTNYNTLTLSQALALNEKGYAFELNNGAVTAINKEAVNIELADVGGSKDYEFYMDECVGF